MNKGYAMNDNTKKSKQELLKNGYTLVLSNGENIITSRDRGVKPLLKLLETEGQCSLYSAADKVVGAAAAYLYVLLDVKEIYASVLSENAEAVLIKNGITFFADNTVPYIINRKGDGMCPMENAVQNAVSPEDALVKIRNQLEKLKNG